MLTLHIYDHCPFCTRVEIVLSHFNVPYERVLYHYGEGTPDWNPEGGPVKLMGKKMLPVLELENHTMMGESLDIVAYIFKKYGGGAVLEEKDYSTELREWEKNFKLFKSKLCRPRIIQLVHLTDWSDERDVHYAKTKYQKMGFDYEEAINDTENLVRNVNSQLVELDGIIKRYSGKNGGNLGMEDIQLLPNLRTLTVVKHLKWPMDLKRYLMKSFEKCILNGCELYFEHVK